MWLSDSQKVGAGFTASGMAFMLLGVILFFDGGLLALGNFLFLAGLTLLIGATKTAAFFARSDRVYGTACFFLGIALVFLKWPAVGILIETFGFINLFRAFFPAAVSFLQTLPVIGQILDTSPFRQYLPAKR